MRQHLTLVEKLIYRLKNCQAFYSRTIQCFLLKSSHAFNDVSRVYCFTLFEQLGSSFCSFTRLKPQNEDPLQKRFI